MGPSPKRTIITSKTTGRRYFLVRSANRSNARRYYVCSKPDCEIRLVHDNDLFCRIHSKKKSVDHGDAADTSTNIDDVDEEEIDDHGEIIDEDELAEVQRSNTLDSIESHEQNETRGSPMESDHNEVSNDVLTSLPISSRQWTKANRHIEIDETTGKRCFRDSSGRRRFLCTKEDCTNMLKCQTDTFCRSHSGNAVTENQNKHENRKRHTAPPSTIHVEDRLPSPEPTMTTPPKDQDNINGRQSDEFESPEKSEQPIVTNRSYRDASGKIRFICGDPSCQRQVPRKSQVFCKKHDPDIEPQPEEKDQQTKAKIDNTQLKQQKISTPPTDVNHNNTHVSNEHTVKKRKHDSQISALPTISLSSIPGNKIIVSATSLLANQWTNILTFVRQFPQVTLATNLNVNNSTTHLLIDDSENNLHCTITKKIVQAAVRRHVFIISSRWINECIRLNQFVDEHPFEITSDSHTTLRLSVQDFESTDKYIFNNPSSQVSYGFAIECRQCQGSINRNELIELIQLSGAKLYDNDKAVDVLLVLCDNNEKNIKKIKDKYLQIPVTTIRYVSSDFLLKSIVKFEIQDIDKYAL